MRRVDWLVGLGALVTVSGGAAALAGLGGCSADLTDCSKYAHDGCPGYTSTTSTSTGTDGGPPPPADCTGDPTAPVGTSTGNIRDTCAIFVRADSTAATPDGTMENPYKTLKDALANTTSAKIKVFACKSMPFSEAVTVSSGIELYGGFDCTSSQWTWTATDRTELDGPSDAVALTIPMSGDGALVSGWKIVGGTPMTGVSSIAVAVDDVPTGVSIKQSDISASAAVAGTDGTTPTTMVTTGTPAPTPVHGSGSTVDACINPGSLMGGAQGATMCGGTDTSGGAGGKGGITGTMNGDGLMGATGVQTPNPNPTNAGVGGVGQTDPNNSALFCVKGQDGLGGNTGSSGNAGSGVTPALTGVTGGDGVSGGTGTPGQGGGGGGGAMSGTFCAGNAGGNGASGGGGGAGGCGGGGGTGGKAGGSSIAILALGTKLTIDVATVTLQSGAAGNGGKGAAGQSGGPGGAGASGGNASGTAPSRAGCAGGMGGTGGDGGPGGGGQGGFSAGIAFAKGPVPTLTFTTAPVVGAKGSGGVAAGGGNTGSNGGAGAICDFSGATPVCM